MMTNSTKFLLALAFSGGVLAGAFGNHAISATKSAVSRVELINADLAEFPGKEARLYTVELAPGAITPRHRHPGHYFSYVLEGTGVLEEDGKPERSLTPGTAYYTHAAAEQPVSWHTVWNTSSTLPLRTLSVLITDKGGPGTIFDKP